MDAYPSIKLTAGKIFNALIKLLFIGGMLFLGGLIAFLWYKMGRPPLRTLGETRLWYAFLVLLCALLVEYRWKFAWIKFYALAIASAFLTVNILHPENFHKTLPPALQSVWFVPHVVVYIMGYAFLGVSACLSVQGLVLSFKKQATDTIYKSCDTMVTLGFVFINLGLVFGAFWAKKAWGHYWTWDPKETWAFLTWLIYLLYLHFSAKKLLSHKTSFFLIISAFAILLICWFGMNLFLTGQNSVHSYK